VNLESMGEICSRQGCLFFVDAIQGLGAFPIDVRAAKIDALAADGHKWLLGPRAAAFSTCARQVQDEIEPIEFGWTQRGEVLRLRLPGHDASSRCRTV